MASESGKTNAASNFASVTPSDATDTSEFRALWVGGAGNVAIEGRNGTQVILSAVPAGTLLPIQPAKVLESLTTATLIIGLK